MAVPNSISQLVAQATKPKRNLFSVGPDPHPSAPRPDAVPGGRRVSYPVQPRPGRPRPAPQPAAPRPARPAPTGGHGIPGVQAPANPFAGGGGVNGAGAPATMTAAPGVPGAPAGPDWMALAKADPRFLLMNPQFAAQENANMARYGYVQNGTGYREATAAENPYSPLVQAREGFKGNFANLQGNQAARGVLFSGGNVSQTKGLAEGLERNIFQNQTAFNDAQQGVSAQRDALITSLMTSLMEHPEDFAQPDPVPGTTDAAGNYTPHPGLSDPRAPLPAPPKTGIETPGKDGTLVRGKPKKAKKPAKKKGGSQVMTPGGSSFGPGPGSVPS